MNASAVLRTGSGEPVPLHGTPAVSPDYRPGEVTIILGYDGGGQPVTLTVSALGWCDDLRDAALCAWASGLARTEMPLAVTP